MSLHVLATGALAADPTRRTSANGNGYATAVMRSATDDGTTSISLIAFGDAAEQLASHQQGSALAISGRGKLSAWTGRDGAEHHGLSVVVEQIASASMHAAQMPIGDGGHGQHDKHHPACIHAPGGSGNDCRSWPCRSHQA